MIPKIKKILYLTDMSLNSAYVFRYALSAAETYDAQLHVLHAFHAPREMGFAEPPVNKEDLVKKIKKDIEHLSKREIDGKQVSAARVADIKVVVGDPTAVILQAVDDIKPDMLLMGTHSKGAIATAILGSVAARVMQRIKIPVCVVPIPELPPSYVRWLTEV